MNYIYMKWRIQYTNPGSQGSGSCALLEMDPHHPFASALLLEDSSLLCAASLSSCVLNLT